MERRTDLLSRIERGLAQTGRPSSDFDLNAGSVGRPDRKLTAAAVLIPLRVQPSSIEVILTKRSARLKHHPGQIAFPGGKQDPGDVDLIATALREAQEEIGLPDDAARILGTLPPHETVTGFAVTPVVARLDTHFEINPEEGEVSEVFCVPLEHLLNHRSFLIEGRYWRGELRKYYTIPYGPYYIWGATARILRALADVVPQ